MSFEIGQKVKALFHYNLMTVEVRKINKKTISVYGSQASACTEAIHRVSFDKLVSLDTKCAIVSRWTKGGYTYRIDTTLYPEKHTLARNIYQGPYIHEEFINGQWMYRKTDINSVPVNGATDNSWFPIPEVI